MGELSDALWLTLGIATSATLLAAVVGVPLAALTARRAFAGRSALEALVLLPLVLPPTVVGYGLIALLGARGWIGKPVFEATGYTVLFRVEGAILAAALVALPLLYLPTRAALAGVDRELEDVATLLGATRWQRLWHVTFPLARRGIASGVLLAFARAAGEFGATIMVLGIQPGRLTLPLSIYLDAERGRLGHALPAVLLLAGASLVGVIVYNHSSLGKRD